MIDNFNIFYDTPAEIFAVENSGGYGSDAEMTLLYVISADIQPVSGETADREFSLTEERRVRMFHNGKRKIEVGNYVRTGGIMYRVEYVESRRTGDMAILREVL